MSVVDDVTVGDDAIEVDEEAAAAGEFLTARVKGFDSNCGWFDTTDELGQRDPARLRRRRRVQPRQKRIKMR